MSHKRPELQAPPQLVTAAPVLFILMGDSRCLAFYNEDEAAKYTRNSRIIAIQTAMATRALELLLLPNKPCLLLDIGCGSGISGNILAENGHFWIGVDISNAMLNVALSNDALKGGDLFCADIGQNLRFRPGTFDGCISISALQWLCNADSKAHDPFRRLVTFFKWLYAALSGGARAAFQFYPQSADQIEMITSAAMRCGFGGGVVVDFPNSTKAKKYFLCLWAGFSGTPPQLPLALAEGTASETTATAVANTAREGKIRQNRRRRKGQKTREWILKKKSKQRFQGLAVRTDTKYTGRKRRDRF